MHIFVASWQMLMAVYTHDYFFYKSCVALRSFSATDNKHVPQYLLATVLCIWRHIVSGLSPYVIVYGNSSWHLPLVPEAVYPRLCTIRQTWTSPFENHSTAALSAGKRLAWTECRTRTCMASIDDTIFSLSAVSRLDSWIDEWSSSYACWISRLLPVNMHIHIHTHT